MPSALKRKSSPLMDAYDLPSKKSSTGKTPQKGDKKNRKEKDKKKKGVKSLAEKLKEYLSRQDVKKQLDGIPSQKKLERRVWGPRDVPITKPSELPDGWTADEPDIAESDYKAQIERCHERIAEGILPSLFQSRLEYFTQLHDQEQEMIQSESQELGEEVVRRLDSLKFILAKLIEDDPDDQLANVEAIIEAYRAKDLVWESGKVTFWVKGKCIAGPKEMDVEEFYALNEEHGPKGFWVEGLDNGLPLLSKLFLCLHNFKPDVAMHMLTVRIRNPAPSAQTSPGTELPIDVVDDTGCETMAILEKDITDLEILSGASVPGCGETAVATASGRDINRTYIVQANIFVHGQPLLDRWVNVRVSLLPPNNPLNLRLSGIWIRHMLYSLSQPDNSLRSYLGTDLCEMTAALRPCDPRNAMPPKFLWNSERIDRQSFP